MGYKLQKRPCSPSNFASLDLKITAIAEQHCLGGGALGGALKGQARGAKREHRDEKAGRKGKCVNNFKSFHRFKRKLYHESLISLFNVHYGYFRFILPPNRQ